MPDPEEEEVRVGPARRHDQAGPTAHPHRPRQGRQQEIQGPQARPGNAVKWMLDDCEDVTAPDLVKPSEDEVLLLLHPFLLYVGEKPVFRMFLSLRDLSADP
jgi:hypothetical protein